MSIASLIKGANSSDSNELDLSRWVIRIAVIVVALLSVLLGLYLIHLWSGKSVWAVLDVLALPITLGAAVPLLNWLQKKRELDVEHQRAQDEALQAYLDQIGELLLDRDKLFGQPGDDVRRTLAVRTLARARTLTILRRLDSGRKRSVLDFLYEADLIKHELTPAPVPPPPIIVLGSPDSENGAADLSGADLRGAVLRGAHLGGKSGHNGANLSGADLSGADLNNANLSNANLSNANLSNADLIGVWEDPQGSRQDIPNGVLEQQAKSLKGATMPDGSKHP